MKNLTQTCIDHESYQYHGDSFASYEKEIAKQAFHTVWRVMEMSQYNGVFNTDDVISEKKTKRSISRHYLRDLEYLRDANVIIKLKDILAHPANDDAYNFFYGENSHVNRDSLASRNNFCGGQTLTTFSELYSIKQMLEMIMLLEINIDHRAELVAQIVYGETLDYLVNMNRVDKEFAINVASNIMSDFERSTEFMLYDDLHLYLNTFHPTAYARANARPQLVWYVENISCKDSPFLDKALARIV
jgi:hypothetical protein